MATRGSGAGGGFVVEVMELSAILRWRCGGEEMTVGVDDSKRHLHNRSAPLLYLDFDHSNNYLPFEKLLLRS
jgi:hypothetical protein